MNISSSFLSEILKEKFHKYINSADLVEGLKLARIAHEGLAYDDQDDLINFILAHNIPHSEAIIEELNKRVSLKSKILDLQSELDRLVNIQFNKDLEYSVEDEINSHMDRIILLETCDLPQN